MLAQQEALMDSIQRLRHYAYEAGNLRSGDRQVVVMEERIIRVAPVSEVIYLPAYSPTVVYGSHWRPSRYHYRVYEQPESYWYPSGYAPSNLVSFGLGVAIGYALWADCDWHGRRIGYHGRGRYHGDRDRYPDRDRGHDDRRHDDQRGHDRDRDGDRGRDRDRHQDWSDFTVWQHNPDHRQGVRYRDLSTEQKYEMIRRAHQDRRKEEDRDPSKSRDRDPSRDDKGRDDKRSGDKGKDDKGREDQERRRQEIERVRKNLLDEVNDAPQNPPDPPSVLPEQPPLEHPHGRAPLDAKEPKGRDRGPDRQEQRREEQRDQRHGGAPVAIPEPRSEQRREERRELREQREAQRQERLDRLRQGLEGQGGDAGAGATGQEEWRRAVQERVRQAPTEAGRESPGAPPASPQGVTGKGGGADHRETGKGKEKKGDKEKKRDDEAAGQP